MAKEIDDFHNLTEKISDRFGISTDVFEPVISISLGRIGLHIKREMYDVFRHLAENANASIEVSEHKGEYGWKNEVVKIPGMDIDVYPGMDIDVYYSVYNSYLDPHPSYLEYK